MMKLKNEHKCRGGGGGRRKQRGKRNTAQTRCAGKAIPG
jgi:hypothetical protein